MEKKGAMETKSLEDIHDEKLAEHYATKIGIAPVEQESFSGSLPICRLLQFCDDTSGFSLFITKGLSGWVVRNANLEAVRIELAWFVIGVENSAAAKLFTEIIGLILVDGTPPAVLTPLEMFDLQRFFPGSRVTSLCMLQYQRLTEEVATFESGHKEHGRTVMTNILEITALSARECSSMRQDSLRFLNMCANNRLADPALIYRDFDFV